MAAFWMIESSLTSPAAAGSRQLYINQYKDLAIQEQQRTGIPASIILAQAILESAAGTSEVALFANNHFGMKCTSDWKGGTYQRIDDEKDEWGNPKYSCFKIFPNVATSFEAHSALLLDPRRPYRQLLQLNPTDYQGWAVGLQRFGYATDPSYALKLTGIIEKYQLFQYDQPAIQAAPVLPQSIPTTDTLQVAPEKENSQQIILEPQKVLPKTENIQRQEEENELFVYARFNETMEDIARRTGKRVLDLLVYNDYYEGGDHLLPRGMRVYLRSTKYFALNTAEDANSQMEIARGENQATKKPLIPDLEIVYNRLRKQKHDTPPVQHKNPVNLSALPIADSNARIIETLKESPNRAALPDSIHMAVDTSIQAKFHIVGQGDTLWNISQRFGTTVAHLQALNHLDSTNIRLGARLQVP